jgi:ribonuclease P protein component
LVVHALGTDSASRAGFVVSKAVGNAVIRNRVKRRLRHLAMPALAEHPVGVDFVVRAFPAATNGDLAQDFKSALASCYRKLGQS